MKTLCSCWSLQFDAAGRELRLEGRPAARFTLLSGDESYSTENSEEPVTAEYPQEGVGKAKGSRLKAKISSKAARRFL
jgi:hypothetical protein